MHKNAPTSILSCRLESKCDCVRILHSMVEVIAGRVGLDCVEANRLALAANELFANICSHGYKDEVGIIEVDFAICPSELCLEFRDFGLPVACMSQLKGRDLDDVRPGGLGLHLMHTAMDEVHHESLNDGNRWTLIWHLNGEEARSA
ncbi:MAG: ATP-binding protein [Mariprofundaceae bacterium]